MAKETKGVTTPGKTRATILVNSALWAEFKARAKEQGKTLPKAAEDALRGAMRRSGGGGKE